MPLLNSFAVLDSFKKHMLYFLILSITTDFRQRLRLGFTVSDCDYDYNATALKQHHPTTSTITITIAITSSSTRIIIMIIMNRMIIIILLLLWCRVMRRKRRPTDRACLEHFKHIVYVHSSFWPAHLLSGRCPSEMPRSGIQTSTIAPEEEPNPVQTSYSRHA